MPGRNQILLQSIPRDGRIIEFGGRHNPIAPKAEGWYKHTIDSKTREELVAAYSGQPNIDTGRIEEVDYVWHEGPLTHTVPAVLHGTFDAFIGSRMIECTADVISFLDSAAKLVSPGGLVALAIQDKRYNTDYFEPLSTTGQLIETHAEQRGRASRPSVFDNFAYAVTNGDATAWGQHPSHGLRLTHSLEQAWEQYKTAVTTPEASDSPLWHFTPSSFRLFLLETARLGLTDWRVDQGSDAMGSEFFVTLRRGGVKAASNLSETAFADKRLALLKRVMLETRAQIDWLLAGEPEIAAGQLSLLATHDAPPPPPAPPPAQAPISAASQVDEAPRYVDWFPNRENAMRAFEGEWSSAVPGFPNTGPTPLFGDPRIVGFEERLGGFNAKRVLELGPLEAGHTYMMTQRGAVVTAIESNVRAWIRCIVVKDILDIFGATFLLGDFVKYLASSPPRVDFLLASGVLYHMTDPVAVLRDMTKVSDAIGLWTHYFDPENLQNRTFREKFDFQAQQAVTPHGRTVELFGQRYLQALQWKGFCGGSAPGSNWLRREDILGILEDEGFETDVFSDEPSHPNGPAFCVFAKRR